MAGTALFVYGTLTDEGLVVVLTGRRFVRRPARLEGYERVVPARGYPYVVPRAGRHVEGFLVEDVDAASLRRLDTYEDEGRLYLRRPAEVVVAGDRRTCEVYVGRAALTAPRARGPGRGRRPASGG
ncbi:MAG TPA: gamma-glutamylcyclotransferase family protein [Candidatus Binatia bacterium]|nr:gamma-glutamylcyclotransferase family protein [Candidatus Binatia bacterium]